MTDPRTFQPVDRWLYGFLGILLAIEVLWLNLPSHRQAATGDLFAFYLPGTCLVALIALQLACRWLRFSGLANMVALGVLLSCPLVYLFVATSFAIG